MGQIRDLFKKIRDTKGTFHAKMSTVRDRNGTGLTEAEYIKKRWQENTEELQKRSPWPRQPRWCNHSPRTRYPGMRVKWVLGVIMTNKASGGIEIPVELFQILKDDAVKVLNSIFQEIWKTQQWSQDWKRSVFIPIPKKCKKAKWLCEEALQIAVKRREVKSKGEKERYTHLNAEFQRTARRDKKAFLSANK